MARRATAWLTLATAVVLAAGCTTPRALRPGDPAPRWRADAGASGTELLWLLRDRDVYACRSAAFALRRLGAAGLDLHLRVIGVGSDGRLIEDFVRSQRIRADLASLNASEYRRHFGATDLPALVLVQNGRVTHVWASAAGVIAATDGEVTEIQRAVGKAGVALHPQPS